MQELKKILYELEKRIFTAEVYNDDFDGTTITNLICLGDVRDILEKHMNDGWISVEDERLWDILFEEACVEGEQAKRIYNRLKETFGGERSEMDGKF